MFYVHHLILPPQKLYEVGTITSSIIIPFGWGMRWLIGKEGFELGYLTPNSHFSTLQELQGKKGAERFYCKSRNILRSKSRTFSFSGAEEQAGFAWTLETGLECINSPWLGGWLRVPAISTPNKIISTGFWEKKDVCLFFFFFDLGIVQESFRNTDHGRTNQKLFWTPTVFFPCVNRGNLSMV